MPASTFAVAALVGFAPGAISMWCPSGKMCPDPDGGAFKTCVNTTFPTGGCGYTCFNNAGTQYWCDDACGNCKDNTPAYCAPGQTCSDPAGGDFVKCVNISYGAGAGNCGYECWDAHQVPYFCDNVCNNCKTPPPQSCKDGPMCTDPDAGSFTKCVNVSYGAGVDDCGYECWDAKGVEYFCDNKCGNCKHNVASLDVIASTCPNGKMCPDPDGGAFKTCANTTFPTGGCGYTCFNNAGTQYWCDDACENCKHNTPPPPSFCPPGKMCTDPDGGSFTKCVNVSYGAGADDCGYECWDAQNVPYWCDNKCDHCDKTPAQSCKDGAMCHDPDAGSFTKCVNISYGAGVDDCGYECWDAKSVEYFCDNKCGNCKHNAVSVVVV